MTDLLTATMLPVLAVQALLPWVTGSFDEEEKEAMMGSLRAATKNTMFDQWLGAVQQSGGGGGGGGSSSSCCCQLWLKFRETAESVGHHIL